MLILNKTPAAATNSNIARLLERANRAPVRFRMTSSNQENGFDEGSLKSQQRQTDPAEHKNSKGRSCRHTEHHCCLDDGVAHWISFELVPSDVPFDKFLVSPLRAMASSPDLSGNELSRDRSSGNDHRPQVPAARLSVCRNSSVCLFDRVVMSDHLPIPILFSTKSAHTPYGMGCTVNLIPS